MRFFKKLNLRPVNVKVVQSNGSEVERCVFTGDILRCVPDGEKYPSLTVEYVDKRNFVITQRAPTVHFSLGELRGYLERETVLRAKEGR